MKVLTRFIARMIFPSDGGLEDRAADYTLYEDSGDFRMDSHLPSVSVSAGAYPKRSI